MPFRPGIVILCALLTVSHWPVQAEVGPLSAIVNQSRMGQWCRDVRPADLRAAGIDCPEVTTLSGAMAELRTNAQRMLDRTIYDDAARRQIQRNSCLSEQVAAVRTRPGAFETWSAVGIAAWLGLRKSQLMRTRCRNEFWNSMDPVLIERYGFAEAYARTDRNRRQRSGRTEAPQAWRDVCLSERWARGLQRAEQYFGLMIPVTSTPEIFSAVEQNRDSILITRPGQAPRPISDNDLLELDLNDMSSISVRGTALGNAMASALDLTASGRRAINQQLNGSRRSTPPSSETFELDEDLRRYVYQDGMLDEALEARGLLMLDSWGARRSITPSASCVLAWQQTSGLGSILDYAGVATVAGGAVSFLPRMLGRVGFEIIGGGARAGRRMYSARTALGAVSFGLAVAQTDDVLQTAGASCMARLRGDPRMTSAIGRDAILQTGRWSLPGPVGFDPVTLEFPPDQVPSCPARGQKLSVDSAFRTHCGRDLFMSVSPPWAMPAGLVMGQ